MSEVMIEARDLVKRYDGVLALDKVSMKVNRGEVLGFLGPNGAGKSTTMKILTCFTAPTEGTASVNGHDVTTDSLGVRALDRLPAGEQRRSTPTCWCSSTWSSPAEMRGLDSERRAQAHQGGRRRDRPRRRDRQADPRAVQRLQPARRPRPGAGPRAADPDPGRADERSRPEPGRRDPRPDQGHRHASAPSSSRPTTWPRCRSPATAC